MDVKGKVLLQLLNKSKLRKGTKTFLEQKFFSKFKKVGFGAPLNLVTLTTKNMKKLITWDVVPI